MKWRVLALFALAPLAAQADSKEGFTYQRGEITIMREKLPPQLPWLPTPDPAVKFDVEIRDAGSNYSGQTGWFNMSGPVENGGAMMVFPAPGLFPLTRSMDFAPLDVAMIGADGRIGQIVHNVKLSDLDHEIAPEKPVRVFLFLQGGATEKLFINPDDRVESAPFGQASPVIGKDGK